MTSRISRSSGSLVLLVVILTSAVLPRVLPVCRILYAQLNCQTRYCVEVRYQAKVPGVDRRNIYCVREMVENGKHKGKAYSEVCAVENCYGQNSMGGRAADFTRGHYWLVECIPDCSDIPDTSLCSAGVRDYLSTAMETEFPSKCRLGDPEPDPNPNP